MNRLRHPVRAIREPFGTAGLIVAMIALVAALGGTALAASKLNSTQKKEVEKIAKKYAGKAGPAGAVGPAGTAGPAGPKGDAGSAGGTGPAGKSVALGTATSTPSGECPTVGGTTVEVEGTPATKKKVCNGKEGSPWTAGGTLPSGKTETGTYNIRSIANAVNEARTTAISFPIPLAEHGVEHFEFNPISGPFGPNCTGSAAEPKAAAGTLCIYEGEAEFIHAGGLTFFETASPAGGAAESRTGTELVFLTAEKGAPPVPITPGEEVSAEGTWAVTAK